MKLIKKIAAIMFAFMMVVSMSCNVKANDTTTPATGETGTITINNAIPKQTYTIYKILDLESYEPKKNEQGEEIGNYSYKPNKDWTNFISTAVDSTETTYFKVDENGYARWNVDKTKTAEFAQKALAYAKDKINGISSVNSKKAESATVTFNDLALGYYLVDSSVGALCSLDTTNPSVIIKEKNGVPSADKKVSNSKTGPFDTSSTASIGDTVFFKTTITAQPGAQNYVLHDKMTEGLTFDQNSVNVSLHKNAQNTDRDLSKTTDYSVETTNLESTNPKCTFHVNFIPTFCDSLEANDTITVTYSATLNANAVIGNDANTNTNKTLLSYGDSQKTTEVTTNTKTFEMHVFKFYKDKKNSDKETGLADAVFTLSKKSDGTEPIKLTKTNENSNIYKVNNNGTIADITTPGDGKFTIQGLGAGTYYLTEIKQPDGYNKLAKSVKVEIAVNGAITVDGKLITGVDKLVKVENKTGTVLPSTGGTGTTMIYLVGAVLVLGSGVVLVTKRRIKNK